MKIDKITIAGILGIARAEINLNGVTVVAGLNHVGKSSIADAVSMAFLGTVSRVSIPKKSYDQLLHDGSPKGRVTVLFDGDTDQDEEQSAEFRLPKGEHLVSQIENSQYLPYVLRPQLFAEISDDERRTLLFNLTGCKAGGKEVIAKLIARDIPESVVRDFIPNLKNGFPAASAAAYELAKQAKGAWRGITGENWGSDKAEGWEAANPDEAMPKDEEMKTISYYVAKTQEQIEDGMQWIGQQETLLKATESFLQRLTEHEVIANQLKRRVAKRDATSADMVEWEGKIPELEKRLAELRAGVQPLTCPCCDAELRMVDGELQIFAGLKADTAAASTAALELTKSKEALNLLKRTYQNDVTSVAEAESAVKQVAAIKAEKRESVDVVKLEAARLKIEELREGVKTQRAAYNAKQELRNTYTGLAAKNENATKAHAEIKQWLALGDGLAPDGIPSELLADALAPFNQSLAVLARLSGWRSAAIGADMQLRYGERLYGLCSVSEKWRCNALIAFAIAQMSTLKMVVLDGFDVLDLKSRGSLVKMSIELEELTAMESIVLIGTLKEPPKMPVSVAVAWVENAMVEN